MSPLGATRIWRGPFSSSANNSTLNPAGTCGTAAEGRGTTRDTLADDGVAPGRGRSLALIRRLTPGLSARQSPNAAAPTSGPDWASAPQTPVPANTKYAAIKYDARPFKCIISRSLSHHMPKARRSRCMAHFIFVLILIWRGSNRHLHFRFPNLFRTVLAASDVAEPSISADLGGRCRCTNFYVYPCRYFNRIAAAEGRCSQQLRCQS